MRNPRVCSIESLETRSLFAANPADVFRDAALVFPTVQSSDLAGLTVNDGTLTITATHKSDNIVVTRIDAGGIITAQQGGKTTIVQVPKNADYLAAIQDVQVRLTDEPGSITFVGGPVYSIAVNGHTYNVRAADINKIVINGGDGNDTIRIAKNVRTQTTVNGGAGNDTLEAGRKTDILNGNAGNDTLITSFDATTYSRYRGGDGKDTLFSVNQGIGTATTVRQDIETVFIELRRA